MGMIGHPRSVQLLLRTFGAMVPVIRCVIALVAVGAAGCSCGPCCAPPYCCTCGMPAAMQFRQTCDYAFYPPPYWQGSSQLPSISAPCQSCAAARGQANATDSGGNTREYNAAYQPQPGSPMTPAELTIQLQRLQRRVADLENCAAPVQCVNELKARVARLDGGPS